MFVWICSGDTVREVMINGKAELYYTLKGVLGLGFSETTHASRPVHELVWNPLFVILFPC